MVCTPSATVRGGDFQPDPFPCQQAAPRVVACLGLDANHARAWPHRLDDGRDAADHAAPADGDKHRVGRVGLLREFERLRSLSGHHLCVVVGMDVVKAPLGGKGTHPLLTIEPGDALDPPPSAP